MARTMNSALANALDDPVVYPFFAIDLLFDSGALYIWTGLGPKTISGRDYVGSGNLMQISVVEETSELSANGATITLSGIPSSLLSLALTEPYQGRKCRIYFGVTGDTTAMTETFTGYMDQMTINEGPDTCNISLSVESRLIDLERPRIRKYNNSDQKSRYPTDKGFEFVEKLQNKELYWGKES